MSFLLEGARIVAKMNLRLHLLSPLLLGCTAAVICLAQRAPVPPYEDTNNVPISPDIHGDRTVTFRLFAPKASEVILMGSPGILEAIKKPMPLSRDDKGMWSLTVGPLRPASTPTATRSTEACECLTPRIRISNCAGGGQPACSLCLVRRRPCSRNEKFRMGRFISKPTIRRTSTRSVWSTSIRRLAMRPASKNIRCFTCSMAMVRLRRRGHGLVART